MKVALCCIGRLENRYSIEFVEYYKNLGVDKILIADNNHDGEEHFEDVLQKYVDGGYVDIIDYRNRINVQNTAYTEIYYKYYKYYDYMIFVDFDEFICLTQDKNIKEYLSRNTKDYEVILLNWMIYTDNDLVYDDGRPCLERFTTPMQYDKFVSFQDFEEIRENDHTKCIVNCKCEDIIFVIPHFPNAREYELSYCNNKFEEPDLIHNDHTFIKYDFTFGYVKHFSTKTIDEYLNIKVKRGTGDRTYEVFLQKYNTDWFFKINNITPEKRQYIRNFYKNKKEQS